jgi:hypothetical protein
METAIWFILGAMASSIAIFIYMLIEDNKSSKE